MMAGVLRIAAAAGCVALGAVLACGKHEGQPAAPDPCGDYLDAILTSPCNTGPRLPDDELARLRARFATICAGFPALPGSGMTDDQLEACASAIVAAGCVTPGTLPDACLVTGSLADGAPCNEPFQCTGGQCFQGAAAGPDASTGTGTACGTCGSIPTLGQPCQGSCATGSVCDHTAATPTCIAVTAGAAGAHCDGLSAVCAAGLYCDAASGVCATLPTDGQPCTSTGLCTTPAWCYQQTCQPPGTQGAPCGSDDECAAGLGCSLTAETCGAVTWVDAGQPCGDLARCLVGGCDPGSMTCPAVIPDGGACNGADSASTCDSLDGCLGGTCLSV
ncbi:MAG TPA: hypothetical protein VIY73_01100, partial [Polyangiaceae bacterium]